MIFNNKKTTVCVQGLGFVGSAMSILIASTKKQKKNLFNVYGLEKKTKRGIEIIKNLNAGKFITKSTDKKLEQYLKELKKSKNFFATTNPEVISRSKIVICNVNLDLDKSSKNIIWDFKIFKHAILTIGKFLSQNSLLIIETTVPPGTCEKFVMPILKSEFSKRKLNPNSIMLAHSFERVMPGENYLDSIKNYWRVYSANNNKAAKICELFYKQIINTKKYKLTKLKSMTDSEFCKVLENTYRAVNIAFIDEWSRFAEQIDVDMFEVIKAIKYRKTHSNIMKPGFGVGGYCLTKDPLFAKVSASQILKKSNLNFPITQMAVKINDKMPISSIKILANEFKSLNNKIIGLLGVTYRENIGDYRYSPANFFANEISKYGAKIIAYDPMIKIWKDYKNLDVSKLFNFSKVDAIVLTIPHQSFRKLNFSKLIKKKLVVLDTFNILTKKQIDQINKKKCKLISIGRGIA